MSYRSGVAIVFYKSALTNSQKAEAEELLDYLCEENYNLIKEDQDYFQFYSAQYKWRDDNENVQALYTFFEEIPEEAYYFLRVGEEPGDLETWGEGEFGLSYLFQIDPASLPLEPN